MKIIIIGAHGFIGSSLVNRFMERGDTVIGIDVVDDIHGRIDRKDDYTYMHVSEIEEPMMEDADLVYDLAWDISSYANGKGLSSCLGEIENIRLSCEMMDLAIKIHAKKFIFAGSISEEMYYFTEDGNMMDIKNRIYGIAKQTASDMCRKMAYDEGMEYCKVILANTYGPGDYSNKAVNTFIRKMEANEPLQLIEGNDLADWMYIEDTVSGLIHVGEEGKNMESYYIGHKEIPTFKEYIISLKEILGSRSELDFGAYPETTRYDYGRIDRDKIYKDTNFRIEKTFEEEIKKTARWLNEKSPKGGGR